MMPEEDVTDVLRAEGKNNKDQKDKDNDKGNRLRGSLRNPS